MLDKYQLGSAYLDPSELSECMLEARMEIYRTHAYADYQDLMGDSWIWIDHEDKSTADLKTHIVNMLKCLASRDLLINLDERPQNIDQQEFDFFCMDFFYNLNNKKPYLSIAIALQDEILDQNSLSTDLALNKRGIDEFIDQKLLHASIKAAKSNKNDIVIVVVPSELTDHDNIPVISVSTYKKDSIDVIACSHNGLIEILFSVKAVQKYFLDAQVVTSDFMLLIKQIQNLDKKMSQFHSHRFQNIPILKNINDEHIYPFAVQKLFCRHPWTGKSQLLGKNLEEWSHNQLELLMLEEPECSLQKNCHDKNKNNFYDKIQLPNIGKITVIYQTRDKDELIACCKNKCISTLIKPERMFKLLESFQPENNSEICIYVIETKEDKFFNIFWNLQEKKFHSMIVCSPNSLLWISKIYVCFLSNGLDIAKRQSLEESLYFLTFVWQHFLTHLENHKDECIDNKLNTYYV